MSPDWTEIPALENILQIVARTNNRAFVGLPLCKMSLSALCAILTMSVQQVDSLSTLRLASSM